MILNITYVIINEMQRYVESTHKIISEWVNQFCDELYAWSLFKIVDEGAAQDAVQETFITAFQQIDNFRGFSSPKTWLFSILNNKIVDHYRREGKKISTTSSLPVDETASWFDDHDRWEKRVGLGIWNTENENLLDNPEFESVLRNCLGNLPALWFSCVQLKYLGEKDSGYICQELHISPSNLWQILHRAKLHLRNCLEINWFKHPRR